MKENTTEEEIDLDDIFDNVPDCEDLSALDELLGASSPVGVTEPAVRTANSPEEDPAAHVLIPRPRRAPPNGPPPSRVHPLRLKPFKDPPPHVKMYLTNACYYANQILVINNTSSRAKRGIVINDSNIYIMTNDAKVEATIPVTQVEALIMQDILTVRSLGILKERHTHVLLHLREMPDVLFALPEDKKKDPETGLTYAEKLPALDFVLRELLLSYEIDLPVCRLGEGESIRQLMSVGVTDVAMRHECVDVLAHRTTLLATLQGLVQRNAQLVTQREQIEAANASPVVTSLLREIEMIEGKNEMVVSALRQTNASLERCKAKERGLRDSLVAVEAECEAVARDRVAEQQGETIARQALECQLLREAHQTAMRHLNLLCAFLKTRAERRRGHHAVTASELEADVAQLARLRQTAAARKDAATDKLAEAKRRLNTAQAALVKAKDEVEALRQLPQNGPIPPDFNRRMAPTFLPLYLPEDPLCSQNIDVCGVNILPQNASSAIGVKKTELILSDDEDDINLALPQRPSANTKLAIVVDDDDL